jgi:trehalose 6-phosphate phosphatase
MEFSSAEGAQRYDDVVAVGARLLVALDFDGTLSPIVDNPAVAHIHDRAPELLVALADQVRTIAVVTGRPARQVLALGGLDEVGDEIAELGHELVVLGQYGNERWTSSGRRIISPKPPSGLASLISDLPRLLRQAGVTDAHIEEKGLAVGVHTRPCADPAAAYATLLPVLTEAAEAKGLRVEPGRLIIEIRAAGMDKGIALRSLVEQFDVEGIVFVGDDLGDLPAFAVARELSEAGMPTFLVCSLSDEESALRELADAVVAGPDGVMDLLDELRTRLAAG